MKEGAGTIPLLSLSLPPPPFSFSFSFSFPSRLPSIRHRENLEADPALRLAKFLGLENLRRSVNNDFRSRAACRSRSNSSDLRVAGSQSGKAPFVPVFVPRPSISRQDSAKFKKYLSATAWKIQSFRSCQFYVINPMWWCNVRRDSTYGNKTRMMRFFSFEVSFFENLSNPSKKYSFSF